MKKLCVLVPLALSSAALAAPTDTASADAWKGARPNVEISVAHAAAPDTYTVNAVVTDLRTGHVLAKPVMLTRAGMPARAEVGGVGVEGMASVAFTVTVDASGQTAAYSSEVRDNAEVVASQSA